MQILLYLLSWVLGCALSANSRQHQIRIGYVKGADSFGQLRRLVGYIHSSYCPENCDDLPQIMIVHDGELNRRELSEIAVWDRVDAAAGNSDRGGGNLTSSNVYSRDIPEKYACAIRARVESFALHVPPVFVFSPRGRQRPANKELVIGVPTSSKGIPFVMEQPVLSILLPSLLKSLRETEYDEWQIRVMVVFDEGDFFFDNEFFLGIIAREIVRLVGERRVAVEIYRHPVRNRLLYLWNWMYHKAMQHKNTRYFYQLNDDFSFAGQAGWLSSYSHALETANKSIAYPFDSKKFGCTLPCQALIGRRHFDRFGFLFPPEIKDWHGDTFLGLLYHGQGYCSSLHGGYNGRPGKRQYRYNPCRHVDFHRLLGHYSRGMATNPTARSGQGRLPSNNGS